MYYISFIWTFMVTNGNSKHQSVLELKNKRISQLNIYLLIMRSREYVKICTTSKNFTLLNIASGIVHLSIPSTNIYQYTNMPIYQYTNIPIYLYTSIPLYLYTSLYLYIIVFYTLLYILLY